MSTMPKLFVCPLLLAQEIQHINPPGRKTSPAYTPPAATLVGVQSLASEDWLVEIEVTAVIR